MDFNTRSGKILKNLSGMFVLKGLNVAVTFLLVPITLNILDDEKYGIWITISGILLWIGLFDVGLGNGLRNKLTEALAKNNIKLAKELISTTYVALFLIFLSIFLIFQFVNQFIDWQAVLNTSIFTNSQFAEIISVIFGFICLRFVFNTITFICFSKLDPVYVQLMGFLGKVLSLCIIIGLSKFITFDLFLLGLIYSSTPVAILFLFSIYLFKSRYSYLIPNIKNFKAEYLKELLNLGGKFFLIQISTIVFYQSQNLIITQIFGPLAVTEYSITFQLFSVITILFSIILTPFWSAFTDAYSKEDVEWIRKSLKRMVNVWVLFVFFSFLIFFGFDLILEVWIKKEIFISSDLKFSILAYVVINSLLSIYSNFLNGVGKVSIQYYLAIIFALFQIPLSIFCGRHFGVAGVLFPSILFSVFTFAIFYIQTGKILNKSAIGIWNK
ncbi:lipopolysaccharide biosynthesis protein [Algoriphagus formosus]|uniref:Polysaccharide biosynthesis protein n=1 Tax=Algoriphagus formosus TaxID=2007308 RepID=A0A4R5USE3_9BACT|nr:hypothetical protein [Algoriphagus aquimaris]TDK42038.1 hypothetical protein E1898_18875 [Algoriphagus aquimaris]